MLWAISLIRREGIGSALEHPIAAALGQAKRFHIEIQIAYDDLLLVRVRLEPGVGAADLLDPLEVDGPFGTWQFPLGDELEIGTADLQGQSATRIVVVGALLDVRLEEVAADGYFLRGANNFPALNLAVLILRAPLAESSGHGLGIECRQLDLAGRCSNWGVGNRHCRTDDCFDGTAAIRSYDRRARL
jgi:hypothetical protein